MASIDILELVRSKTNTTLSVVTKRSDSIITSRCTCICTLEGEKPVEDIGCCDEVLFAKFDDLLLDDGATYALTVLPDVSLVIRTKDEEFIISSNRFHVCDMFNPNNKSIGSPVQILTDIIRSESIPVKITIKYKKLDQVAAPLPKAKVAPSLNIKPAKQVKPKGYTNVIVGHEDVSDPIEHRDRIIAEVMQHVSNVTNGNTHETIPTEPEKVDTLNARVTEEEVKKYRDKIFNEGLKELAKESKRKAEQPATSTEDDFTV
jgi:hypothetical protein